MNSRAMSQIRAKVVGRLEPPSTKPCPHSYSQRPSTNALARVVRPTSPTRSCLLCVTSSAVTMKRKTRHRLIILKQTPHRAVLNKEQHHVYKSNTADATACLESTRRTLLTGAEPASAQALR